MAPDVFSSPIFDPLREWLGNPFPGDPPDPEKLNTLRNPSPLTGGGVPLKFVQPRATGIPTYVDQFEVRAFLHGEIAVRNGSWHDTFNALTWLAFPRTKAAINRCHFEGLECERKQRGIGVHEAFSAGEKRGSARDALTLFDESGIIVASANVELLELIRRHEWKTLFWTRRDEVRQYMRFFVFGHAMHEKAMKAYKGMTARALLLSVTPLFLEWSQARQLDHVDARAAENVDSISMESKRMLSPLPVMGIPEWAINGTPDFYDDAEVFR